MAPVVALGWVTCTRVSVTFVVFFTAQWFSANAFHLIF